MKRALIDKLARMNNRFYEVHAASFSATRKSPWHGWRTAVELLEAEGAFDAGRVLDAGGCAAGGAGAAATRVLDVACGNLRFEEFLTSELPECSFEFVGMDSCPALLDGRASVAFVECDVAGALAAGEALFDCGSTAGAQAACVDGTFDLAVSFGFIHHLPTFEMREALLDALLDSVRRGGFVVVSFWEFMNNEQLAKKARATHAAALKELALSPTEIAQLDENDYFLGWKESREAYRYCHSFTASEIDALLAAVGGHARPVSRFHADGRSGNLNEYVVLKSLGINSTEFFVCGFNSD